MSDAAASRQGRSIESWLFVILRFAITRQTIDRAAVMALAKEMDRLSERRVRREFTFFVRTSKEICDLISNRERLDDVAALRRHLSRITNDRIRRALEAVLEIERLPAKSAKLRNWRLRGGLWRGLPVRH